MYTIIRNAQTWEWFSFNNEHIVAIARTTAGVTVVTTQHSQLIEGVPEAIEFYHDCESPILELDEPLENTEETFYITRIKRHKGDIANCWTFFDDYRRDSMMINSEDLALIADDERNILIKMHEGEMFIMPVTMGDQVANLLNNMIPEKILGTMETVADATRFRKPLSISLAAAKKNAEDALLPF